MPNLQRLRTQIHELFLVGWTLTLEVWVEDLVVLLVDRCRLLLRHLPEEKIVPGQCDILLHFLQLFLNLVSFGQLGAAQFDQRYIFLKVGGFLELLILKCQQPIFFKV